MEEHGQPMEEHGRHDTSEPAASGVRDAPADHARLILETANDAFVSVDRSGTIVDWNRAAETILGWRRDTVLGRDLAETIIPPTWRSAHRSGFDRYLETGDGPVLFRTIQLPARHRDGTEFPAEVTIWPSQTADGERINAFLRDVTRQTRRRTYLELLQRVTAAANGATELEPVVRMALDEVAQATGWTTAHALLCDDSGNARPSGWWSAGAEPLPAFREAVEHADDEELPGRVAATGEPAWIADLRDEASPRNDLARFSGHRSAFAFPVLSGTSVIAVLEFFSAVSGVPDDEVLDLLAHIGVQLGRVFERREWQQERQRADQQARIADELRRLEAMKDTFLTAISHELRTPLTAISGMSQLLLDHADELDGSQRRLLTRRLAANAQRLEGLLLDLLDLERLTGGRAEVSRRSVDATSIVRRIVSAGGHAELQISMPADAVIADVDPVVLERIVDNLIGNAAKHTPPGTRVTIHLEPLSDGGLHIVVADDGPGVDDADRERILDAFTRLDQSRDTPGTGIGLSLVDRFASLHGGAVEVSSPPEGGLRFEVTLAGA